MQSGESGALGSLSIVVELRGIGGGEGDDNADKRALK